MYKIRARLSAAIRTVRDYRFSRARELELERLAVHRELSALQNNYLDLGLQASSDEFAVIDRVLLERPRWTAIRGEVQRAFNARLKAHDLKTAAWKLGENPVDRLLGKELCVLAWAVENMAMEKIPVAVRNWLALRPEERWWLFGMTAMSTGRIGDGDKGWRRALRYALGDLVQTDLLQPRARREKAHRAELPLLDLFDAPD